MTPSLPIDAVLPDLLAALARAGQAVLQAPPGAGKTTRVPLALLPLVPGRIVMLEPRRLAARAAAERMAQTLGEAVGGTVGYRIRGEAQVSAATRIEVVTEGILTRMIQSDPALPGVGALLFDEFHERSLNADLGLALALEIRAALRPDLMLMPMSATLDAAPVAALMGDAPMITAEGRSFPVDIRWRDRPPPKGQRLAAQVAELVTQAVAETTGGVLVFLPGEGEIRAVQALLALPDHCVIQPLYGAMPFAAQRAAIAPLPDPARRKVVLATAIAETSLTIEDIRVVVDAGQSRRARFDPGTGMSRLVTERVSRAEATQRAGRAGRVAPGVTWRNWTRGEEGALPAFAPPEIAAADLAPLALELALWGSADLAFLTPPPEAAMAEAQALLAALGAVQAGRITPHGRALAALPLHPRLGHMLLRAGAGAAPLAALMSARDPLHGAGADLTLRLALLSGQRLVPDSARAAVAQLRTEAQRLSRSLPRDSPKAAFTPGEMAALAYPDRIGQRRPGDEARYLLSGGRGAVLPPEDGLAQARYLVAIDLDGGGREARIRAALRIEEAEVRALMADQIRREDTCDWSRRDARVLARRQERLGALVLSDTAWTDAPEAAVARAMCEGVRQLGLRLPPAAARLRARVELVRAGGDALPAMTDEALMAGLEDWLAPHLAGIRTGEAWRVFDPLPALRSMLDWGQSARLDAAAPPAFVTPLGRAVPIDYDAETPSIALRLQEMFGVTRHPMIGRTPLRITLLSPAGRPVQVTTDIPGFWASSYADVRKDMRGQYPKHPWPEDPTVAEPTLRTRPKRT